MRGYRQVNLEQPTKQPEYSEKVSLKISIAHASPACRADKQAGLNPQRGCQGTSNIEKKIFYKKIE